ncbi:signal peptidase II [Patescibacteria group bacterium]|nr:signal peptidase II [Patescibacteria group bacterium]MCG2701517.1 signal peptidase II [Candidatus Parcubacteria bacterium]MBU4209812.1 signal peptidase II [Patescibacteria group bacterium]MBU4265280.1 signal peptidase II [Patescibacteria group bacterium]MBU4389965.1 signal peptidase II [Patescibacteria group bacterium]
MKKKGCKLDIFSRGGLFWLVFGFLFFAVHEFLAVYLDVTKNSGVSFGIGGEKGLIISLCFVIFFVGFYKKNGSKGLELVLVGATINLLDRLRFSFVRDYWNLGNMGIYNNIADWLIFAGLLYFVYERYGNNLRR